MSLVIINELNTVGSHALTTPAAGTIIPYYYDVSGDNNLNPTDALQIINYLNSSAYTASASALMNLTSAGTALPLVSSVPEPSTGWLAVVAAGAMAWLMRSAAEPLRGRYPQASGAAGGSTARILSGTCRFDCRAGARLV